MTKENIVKEINLEYFFIEKFYQFFLVVSAVMISELIVRTVTGFSENPRMVSFELVKYLRLRRYDLAEIQSCLISYTTLVLGFTIFGLWCLRRGKQIGYISVGVLYIFLFVQLRHLFVLLKGDFDLSWDWMVWNFNKDMLTSLF